MLRQIFLTALFSIGCQLAFAQPTISGFKYPLTDFRQPLDIVPPALSGSFGELRSNHFHSGMDFRTNQRQGYPVYATSDGYISRLRVQNSGFGLAVYIDHPNGFTSVYAHLQRFSPRIAQRVKDEQYRNKSYEIDLFPKSADIVIRKGDIIGWSGNSGSSGGPHLHFEIRDSKTEETINPQLFGITVPDNIPPTIGALYVYRLNGQPFTDLTPRQYFQTAGSAGNYRLNSVTTINLTGEVGFGIVSNDRHTGQSGLNGIYSIELQIDGNTIFNATLERFAFDQTRAINSYLDYPGKLRLGSNIQKSFRDPGNQLKIYSGLVNNGRLKLEDGRSYAAKYIVTDVKGNQSTLNFNILGNPSATMPTPTIPQGPLFSYSTANEFRTGDVVVKIGTGMLYDDIRFQYKKLPGAAAGAYSATHQIHNNRTPVHGAYDLWIKPDSSIGSLRNKAVIMLAGGGSQGGVVDGAFIKASPRVFGNFYIRVDTVPPVITPVDIADGRNLSATSRINFKIRDNLSGIRSFNGYIDGRWVLMEFDAKTASLWHAFDGSIDPGKHALELVVEDMKGNIARYKASFVK